MSVMIILILASLGIALVFLFAFLWSIRSGQYDDEQAPAIRILFDETLPPSKSNNTQP